MDAESFTVYIKTDYIYKGISEDLKAGLILEIKNQTDLYVKKKIKKVIGLIKDELGGKIMTNLVILRARTYLVIVTSQTTVVKIKK